MRNGNAGQPPAWSEDRRLAIIVGLNAEARLARRLAVPVFIGGGTAAGAEVEARQAVAAGAGALISLGLAGGLDPAFRPGAVIVPDAVMTRGKSIATDAAISQWLGGATAHRLLGADAIAADTGTKRHLWRDSGAAALDLESGAVARVAAEHGLPFGVLRVICDPAERDLPPAALIALNSGGAVGLARVLRSVLARPSQLPALLVLAAEAVIARRALARRITAVMAHEGPLPL